MYIIPRTLQNWRPVWLFPRRYHVKEAQKMSKIKKKNVFLCLSWKSPWFRNTFAKERVYITFFPFLLIPRDQNLYIIQVGRPGNILPVGFQNCYGSVTAMCLSLSPFWMEWSLRLLSLFYNYILWEYIRGIRSDNLSFKYTSIQIKRCCIWN